MRTRLDKIVEKTLGLPSMGYYNGVERKEAVLLANRAFRHGVEQALIERFAPSVFSPPDIQPAPAEEKHDAAFCTPSDNAVTCACKCHRADRRKGERRKEFQWTMGAWHTRNKDGSCRFGVNRRSGKDRRK